jgi:hypothetical protein
VRAKKACHIDENQPTLRHTFTLSRITLARRAWVAFSSSSVGSLSRGTTHARSSTLA